jgi:hypothetical protein
LLTLLCLSKSSASSIFFPISLLANSIQVSKIGFQFAYFYFIKNENICVFIVVTLVQPTFEGLAFDLVMREEEIVVELTIFQIPLCLFI